MKVEVTEEHGLRVWDSGKVRCQAYDLKAAGVQIAMLIEELDRLRRATVRYHPPHHDYD